MKRLLMLRFCLLLLLSFPVLAQDSLRPVPIRVVKKPALLSNMLPAVVAKPVSSRTSYLDSITKENSFLKSQNDSLLNLLNDAISESDALLRQVTQLKEESRNTSLELEKSKGEHLQSEHTNSVLYIFCFLAGLIVLTAVTWFYFRKKDGKNVDDIEKVAVRERKKTVDTTSIDSKMERIEKLGKLREKGLLTEEEFQAQKKNILG